MSLDHNLEIYNDLKKNKNIIANIDSKYFFNLVEDLLLECKRQKCINEEHKKNNGELREKIKEVEKLLGTNQLAAEPNELEKELVDPEDHNYTRAMLIDICEKAFVLQDYWKNRDTEEAQKQLGECYALLLAGCDFKITNTTGDNTIWLTIYSKGFMYFEGGNQNEEDYYLPTYKRLKEADTKDWY